MGTVLSISESYLYASPPPQPTHDSANPKGTCKPTPTVVVPPEYTLANHKKHIVLVQDILQQRQRLVKPFLPPHQDTRPEFLSSIILQREKLVRRLPPPARYSPEAKQEKRYLSTWNHLLEEMQRRRIGVVVEGSSDQTKEVSSSSDNVDEDEMFQ